MCERARNQAALIAKFAKFKRLRRLNFAKFAMRAAWLRLVRTQLPLGTILSAPTEIISPLVMYGENGGVTPSFSRFTSMAKLLRATYKVAAKM